MSHKQIIDINAMKKILNILEVFISMLLLWIISLPHHVLFKLSLILTLIGYVLMITITPWRLSHNRDDYWGRGKMKIDSFEYRVRGTHPTSIGHRHYW